MDELTWSFDDTVPALLQKYHDEIRVFSFDFSGAQEWDATSNDIISAVASIVAPTNDSSLTITPVAASGTGGLATFNISGGGASTVYLIQCDATLADGTVLTALGNLAVVDPGLFIIRT